MMGSKKGYLKLAVLVSAFFVTVLTVANVFADENCIQGNRNQFYGNKQKCLNESGGHAGIYSVNNYACEIAAYSKKSGTSRNNTCATWLASATNSKSTTIVAANPTGTVPAAIYGMCTMCEDTTSNIEFRNTDGGSIKISTTNFKRNRWDQGPSRQDVTIDVAKFIAGLTPVKEGDNYVYTRKVYIYRSHSDGRTTAPDYTIIKLIVGNVPEPEEEGDLCEKWTPADYRTGLPKVITTIDTRVKNQRLADAGFAGWEETGTWAMPTDPIKWHTCYYPGVQYAADTKVSKVLLRTGVWKQGYEELNPKVCGTKKVTFWPLKDVAEPWENKFRVFGNGIGGEHTFGDVNQDWRVYEAGDHDIREVDNGRNTIRTDAGNEYIEKSNTGSPREVEIRRIQAPKYRIEMDECESESCFCESKYDTDWLYTAYVQYGTATSDAWVKIPYNYKNSTSVTLDDNSKSYVYSGETVEIDDIEITVGQRENKTKTHATYATEVPNSDNAIKTQLIAYVSHNSAGEGNNEEPKSDGDGCRAVGGESSQCKQFAAAKIDGELNGGGELDGETYHEYSGSSNAGKAIKKLMNGGSGVYNAFDASAGDYMCFVSGIYPAESNGDDDMDSSGNGNGKWQYSQPTCTVIAKRPSFQVWGGDMYSGGKIETQPAEKRNIYNAYKSSGNIVDKFDQSGNGITYYGSWVEEGIMLGGTASNGNLASGAATGFNNDSEKAYSGSNGGFASDRSPLTLSNYNDGQSKVESSGMTNNIMEDDDSIKEYGESLIGYWIGDNAYNADVNTKNISINGGVGKDVKGATVMNTRYLKSNVDTLIIGGGAVPKKHTILIENKDNNVKITGDIKYEESSYESLVDVPKLVIFANNVDIACDVKEVDAIIIATGKVDTCSDAKKGDENDEKRDNRLKIFGTVIAGSVELGRSYGQAAWKGSGENGQKEAAEVFDFDSSILLWSEFMASSAETDTYKKVYQNEIAPRY